MSPRILLGVVVAAVVLALLAWLLLGREGDSGDGNGGLEAKANGITVRIADIEYSSASTTIHLEIRHPTLSTSRIGYLFLLDPNDLTIEGFEFGAEIHSLIRGAESGTDRRELRLGAVEDVARRVTFRIERLCAFRGDQDPSCDWREGPWVIEWTPGDDALDPIDRRIAVNQEQTAQGVTVRIHEVRLASTEMVITASFLGTLNGEPVYTGRLTMPRPGSKPLPAEGGGGSSADRPGQPRTFRFPAPPAGTREIVLDAEVDYGQSSLEGYWSFTIPLP